MKRVFLIVPVILLIFSSTHLAQEICKRHVEPTGGFSFCPPEGWSIKDSPDATFKVFVGPHSDLFTPNLNAAIVNAPVSLRDIVSFVVKHYSENPEALGAKYVKLLKQSEFTTFSKQQGVKLVFQSENNGLLLNTTQYWFGGRGDSKLAITFSCIEAQSKVLDPVFDQSMGTFKIESEAREP